MKSPIHTKNGGFTLIELMVSSTIFVLIVIIGIASLLLMNRSYKITQYKKEQFDALNAVMEDMVRNIRVGTHIRCDNGGDYSAGMIESPKDCFTSVDDIQASYKIAFEGVAGVEGDPDDQIVYSFEDDGSGTWTLYKSITGNDGGTFVRLLPSAIHLTDSNIGFSVLYSEDNTDGIQPFVTIRLSGTITYQNDPTTFTIQTAVTPRTPEM